MPVRLAVSIVALIRNTIKEFLEDECTSLASVISYAAFFSIFPLLMGLSAILGIFVQSPDTRQTVMDAVFAYMPGTAEFVAGTMETALEERGQIGFVSLILLLFSGRAVFESTITAIVKAFETPDTRNFFQRLMLVFGVMFGTGGMLILSLVVTTAMNLLASVSLWGIGPFQESLLLAVVTPMVGAIVSTGMFLVLYKLAPTQKFTWHEILPGAIVAGILFEVAKQVFVFYLRQQNYEEAYGPVGAVMGLMLWCYFASVIMLLGAEVASEHAKQRRAREGKQVVVRVGPVISTPKPIPLTRRLVAPIGTILALGISAWAVRTTRRPRAI